MVHSTNYNDTTFVLKQNSSEIRKQIMDAKIIVCPCTSFKDSDWLCYSKITGDQVHGVGYTDEDCLTKEQALALFVEEVRNPVWCESVEEFINEINKANTI